MPQIGYICPDRGCIKFEDCLQKCRLGERCVSTPTLRALSVQRTWTGLPSTTQLLSGTRYSLLKIIKDYYEDIQNLSFILLGNKTHKSLEDNDTEGTAEIEFKDKTQSGIADYYDATEKTLWDYKTSGAFKVHKALGMRKKKVNDPTGEIYTRSGSGYKKGDIKKITIWDKIPEMADKWEWTLQTNRYAIWLEDSNRPVEKIKIEVILRDGGTMSARNYGIEKKIEVIDIPILNREYVLHYFERKRKMLILAIALSWAPRCNNVDSWDGRKCLNYCPVSNFCKEMSNEHSAIVRFQEMEPEILI